MTTLGERLDAIRLRVAAPGADIHAELRHRDQITVGFGPDVYGQLDERALEHQLAAVARLLYVAWTRAYRAALGPAFHADSAQTAADRDFHAGRDALVALGQSGDGRVALAARGLRDLRVRIADGTVAALTAQEFTARVQEAVTALVSDHLVKIRELKLRHFG